MTAREPSAVEVIAEALHGITCGCTPESPRKCSVRTAGLIPFGSATRVLAALKAAGFVVATRDEIRAMSVDELIDADVTRDHEEDER